MEVFNRDVTLITEIKGERDEYGNPVNKTEELTILCRERSVYSTEFYNAANVGLKASHILVIYDAEYSGQKKVIYEGNKFDVLRTYKKGDYLELTVGEKIGK